MNWEAYAIRYGRHERTAQMNFLLPVPDAHEAMPLDYFIWLLRIGHGQQEIRLCRAFMPPITDGIDFPIHDSLFPPSTVPVICSSIFASAV